MPTTILHNASTAAPAIILVDSHCHLDQLDLTAHEGLLDNALDAAKKQGVRYFLCVGIEPSHFQTLYDIAEKYAEVFISVGVHPNDVSQHAFSFEELIQWASPKKVVALGETGLDYYRQDSDKNLQAQAFRLHIQAAKKLNKPLIVHSRHAREDTIRILKEEGAEQCRGVMHCFTEDWDMAKKAIDLGFYISFSGIVTFKNAMELKEVAKKVPLERMLIETDSPYLAPVPYRGKPNEPAYVRLVAEYIAELKQTPFETVATQTTKNFFDLFGYFYSSLDEAQRNPGN